MNDWQLLREYLDRHSERAFADLVDRHLDFVYSVAVRQTHDSHLAEDISQAAFILLARKAGTFSERVILTAWLYRATTLIALAAMRTKRRQQHHEQEAAQMQSNETHNDLWQRVAPELDSALTQLREKDRQALLLRYFRNQSFRGVAASLRLSEDAAKKRVTRALEKLRGLLGRNGHVISGAALATLLTEKATAAAPASLKATVATAAIHSGESASVAALVAEGARSLFQAKLKRLAALSAITIAVLTGLFFGANEFKGRVKSSNAESAVVQADPPRAEIPPQPSPQSPPASRQNTRQISLRVLDEASGAPLALAQVRANFYGPVFDRIDAMTSAQGECSLKFPAKPFDGVAVWVFTPGYVGKLIRWGRSEEFTMPEQYTVRLTNGRTLNGVVQDEEGKPVPVARIALAQLGSDSLKRENINFLPEMAFVLSDLEGRWSCDFVPSTGENVLLLFTHPDFAPSQRSVNLKEVPDPLVFKMSRGVEVAGLVVDTQGQPIAGARVQLEPSGLREPPSGRNALNGWFVFPHAPMGKAFLSVDADGYKPIERMIEIKTATEEFRFELHAMRAGTGRLRGRVVGENALPVPGINVTYRGPSSNARETDWQTKTDRSGRFTWDSAPDGVAEYILSAHGYEQINGVTLVADGTEHTVTIKRGSPLHFRGVVVDAVTKTPVHAFRVLYGDASDPRSISPPRLTDLLGEGSKGTFDLPFYNSFRASYEMLQVEADGYLPHVIMAPEKVEITARGHTNRTARWTGDQQFHVELQPNTGWSGSVFRPDGSPAAGAQVALAGRGFYARMEHQFGKITYMGPQHGQNMVDADADGKFHFSPVSRAEKIIAVADSGWANVPIPSTNSVAIRLQSWGRVEGTVLIGREPGAGQSLGLGPGDWDNATLLKSFPFIYQTKADQSGRFVFTHVPAGRHRLVQRHNNPEGKGALGMSHTTWIDVRAGETSTVTIGGKGTMVSGRLVVAPTNPLADWAATVQRLERKDAASSDTEQGNYRFDFFCKEDGRFIIHDIPAGVYTLKLRVTSKPKAPRDLRDWMPGIGPELGVAEREVAVPGESDAVVDVGNIPVAVKE